MTKPGETPPMPKPGEAPPGKSGEGPEPGGPGGGQPNPAPVLLLLVSDASRFKPVLRN
jgi:hypothetical protein